MADEEVHGAAAAQQHDAGHGGAPNAGHGHGATAAGPPKKDEVTLPGGHKVPKEGVMVAAAAGGVLLLFMLMKKPSGGGSATGSATQAVTSPSSAADPSLYPSAASSGGYVAGASGTGEGNAIDGLSTYMDNLSNQIGSLTAATAAISGPVGASTSSGTTASKSPFFDFAHATTDKYVINRGDGSIYQVNPNGGLFGLNPAQWAAVKSSFTGKARPALTAYGTAPKPKTKAKHPIIAPPKRPPAPVHHHPAPPPRKKPAPPHHPPPPKR